MIAGAALAAWLADRGAQQRSCDARRRGVPDLGRAIR